MDVLKQWLASEDGQRQVSQNEMIIIMDELNMSEVSIKASNTFHLTYSSLLHVSSK